MFILLNTLKTNFDFVPPFHLINNKRKRTSPPRLKSLWPWPQLFQFYWRAVASFRCPSGGCSLQFYPVLPKIVFACAKFRARVPEGARFNLFQLHTLAGFIKIPTIGYKHREIVCDVPATLLRRRIPATSMRVCHQNTPFCAKFPLLRKSRPLFLE